jgi:hypothetical protein
MKPEINYRLSKIFALNTRFYHCEAAVTGYRFLSKARSLVGAGGNNVLNRYNPDLINHAKTMKLIGSTTSPYVRKVRVVMAEKIGLRSFTRKCVGRRYDDSGV